MSQSMMDENGEMEMVIKIVIKLIIIVIIIEGREREIEGWE